GVDLTSYRRLAYAFPANARTFRGTATVGGNPSEAWFRSTLGTFTVAHELGHNFGLRHSHALECGTSTLGTGCSSVDYGDTVDLMGGASNHFNAFQKERLGWLNYGTSPPITTVVASGSYPLDLYETASSGPKALKVLKAVDATTGAKTFYYVEYRQAIG